MAELERLLSELGDAAPGGGVVGICAIGGMAGIGKTTLAVHAPTSSPAASPTGSCSYPCTPILRGGLILHR